MLRLRGVRNFHVLHMSAIPADRVMVVRTPRSKLVMRMTMLEICTGYDSCCSQCIKRTV
ncbi:MAG: hypothetical protein JWL88_205 [Parcubacteria group bacterium]|nr:hypothetical protein [Parcubacteria group bacterium]